MVKRASKWQESSPTPTTAKYVLDGYGPDHALYLLRQVQPLVGLEGGKLVSNL